MGRQSERRLAYPDLLRVVATLAVIVLHCTGGWIASTPVTDPQFGALNLMRALTSWCVPMFVMLSGMFFLDPKKPLTLRSLLLRNALRIVTALVVWSAIYAAADHWPGLDGLNLSWFFSVVKGLLFGELHYHLWFLYAILGLYLITPALRALVRGATRTELHWLLLLIFLLTSVLPTLLRLHPSQTVSTHVNRLNLYFLSGYWGYYIAGYYLKTHPLSRAAEWVIYAAGLLGAVVSVWGTFVLSRADGALNAELYGYFAPNVAAMAVAVFVLCRALTRRGETRKGSFKRLAAVAQVTFGIYLVHDLFLALLRKLGFVQYSYPPLIAVPLQTAAVFGLSFAVAWLLSKIPVVGRYLA